MNQPTHRNYSCCLKVLLYRRSVDSDESSNMDSTQKGRRVAKRGIRRLMVSGRRTNGKLIFIHKNVFSHSYHPLISFRGINSPNHLFWWCDCSFLPTKDSADLPVFMNSYNRALFHPCFTPASTIFTESSTKLIAIKACKSRMWARMIPEHLPFAFVWFLRMLLNRLQQSVRNYGLNNGESFFGDTHDVG